MPTTPGKRLCPRRPVQRMVWRLGYLIMRNAGYASQPRIAGPSSTCTVDPPHGRPTTRPGMVSGNSIGPPAFTTPPRCSASHADTSPSNRTRRNRFKSEV